MISKDKIKGKVTWNDLHSATQQEIRKTYKVNDRELEHSVRAHLDGASPKERRDFYNQFYGRKK